MISFEHIKTTAYLLCHFHTTTAGYEGHDIVLRKSNFDIIRNKLHRHHSKVGEPKLKYICLYWFFFVFLLKISYLLIWQTVLLLEWYWQYRDSTSCYSLIYYWNYYRKLFLSECDICTFILNKYLYCNFFSEVLKTFCKYRRDNYLFKRMPEKTVNSNVCEADLATYVTGPLLILVS